VVWALGTLTPAHATLIVNEVAAIAMVMFRIRSYLCLICV